MDLKDKKKAVLTKLVEESMLLSEEFVVAMDEAFSEEPEERIDLFNDILNDIDKDLLKRLESFQEQTKEEAKLSIKLLIDEKVSEVNKREFVIRDLKDSIDEINENKEDKKAQVKSKKNTQNNTLKNEVLKKIEIKLSYSEDARERDMIAFTTYFTHRYNFLKKVFSEKDDFKKVSSIARIAKKRSDGTANEIVSLIGVVFEKRKTKNGNIILTLEDPSGQIDVLFNKSRKELFERLDEVVYDEVIGITGKKGDGIVFADTLEFPGFKPNELKKGRDVNIAIIGDVHYGSSKFLYDSFACFIKWVNGEHGSAEQRAEAKKIEYIFVVGDLVDGVGIYPAQEEDLDYRSIEEQYERLYTYLSKIPKNIQIIIAPGNHDAVRIAEPQPIIAKEFLGKIAEMENVTLVTNPSVVNIEKDSKKDFEGFDVLLYHGYSIPYFIDNIERIRQNGGVKKTHEVLKMLLEKRHLAPPHNSSQSIPDMRDDLMLIKEIPDIFITGHMHRCISGIYKNINIINSSTWSDVTEFQQKLGIEPQVARVPIINLSTRKSKILNFNKDSKFKSNDDSNDIDNNNENIEYSIEQRY